jgi:hypothetical protein
MLIATAVVGAGPPSLLVEVEELPWLLAVAFEPTLARRLLVPGCMLFNSVRESWAEVIVYIVVDGKGPVRLHSREKMLYSTIPFGFGCRCPTAVTTEVGSRFEESMFGSQLIYAMSFSVTLV